MFTTETKIRVRYSETDKMGYVYYGNYAAYYEVARAEMMREIGFTYKQMEDKGCMMPMLDIYIKYHKPARYDDLLTIKTSIENLPDSRMTFHYEVYNSETAQLLNVGQTTLAFINAQTYRPMRAPEWFLDIIRDKLV